jgi:imidazolonepropionase
VAETYLLRGARQLITLQGSPEARRGFGLAELAIINDGALLIKDGRIEEVGMTRRVENLAAARRAEVIDATGHVVMPAFVDSGVSLVFTHSGTEKNDHRLQSGIPQTAASQREDILDAVRALKLIAKKRLTIRASLLAASLARVGTGTAGVVSGYGLDDTGEVKTLRTVEALGRSVLDSVPTFFGGNAVPDGVTPNDFAERTLVPLTSTVKRRKLAEIAAVRCGPLAFDTAAARTFLQAAQELGLHRSIYSQQFEPDDSVLLALESGAISIAHLEHISDDHVDVLSRGRTIAVLTPAATFHMGLTRFAPARDLIDRGAPVALATAFNPDQCPTYSVPFNMAMACRYLGMSTAEAIVASTFNAACALGRSRKVGSLESGKQADLLILNARDYRELALTPGLNLVQKIMKAGRWIEC